jgi:hypothetical protein
MLYANPTSDTVTLDVSESIVISIRNGSHKLEPVWLAGLIGPDCTPLVLAEVELLTASLWSPSAFQKYKSDSLRMQQSMISILGKLQGRRTWNIPQLSVESKHK